MFIIIPLKCISNATGNHSALLYTTINEDFLKTNSVIVLSLGRTISIYKRLTLHHLSDCVVVGYKVCA